MDATRDGGVYIQYGAEDRSTLMSLPWTLPGMEVEGSTSNMEQTQVYTDGLLWTLPGMEVEGSTSNMEQTQVYTDGSAMDATRYGGGGVYIQYRADTGLH